MKLYQNIFYKIALVGIQIQDFISIYIVRAIYTVIFLIH